MTRTINAALDQRPEALDSVRVNQPTSVDLGVMLNPFMGISELLDEVVAAEFIRAYRGVDVRRGLFPQYRQESTGLDVGYYLGGHLAPVPLHHAHDRRFLLCAAAPATGLPAEITLVNLNDAAHVVVLLIHELPYLGEHAPSRLVGHSKLTLELLCRDTAAGGGHQEHGMEPVPERRARLVEYRASEREHLVVAELAVIGRAVLNPIELSYLLALRAVHAVRVAAFEYALKAGIIIRVLLLKVFECVFRCLHFRLQSSPSNRSIAQNVPVVKGYLPSLMHQENRRNRAKQKERENNQKRPKRKPFTQRDNYHGNKAK